MSATASPPTTRPARLRAALGGSQAGAAEVVRKLLMVADAADAGLLPDTPASLPAPFGKCGDLNAWAMGATSNLTSYIDALVSLAPVAEAKLAEAKQKGGS